MRSVRWAGNDKNRASSCSEENADGRCPGQAVVLSVRSDFPNVSFMNLEDLSDNRSW
jgi:hypothetical protein